MDANVVSATSTPQRTLLWPAFILLCPFFLNDFIFIFVDDSYPGLLWVLDLLTFVIIPTTMFCVLIRSGHVSPKDVGLATKPKILDALIAVPLGFIVFTAFYWFIQPTLLQNECLPSYCNRNELPVVEPWRTGFIWYAAISAGIIEEILARGVLMTALLKQKLKPYQAIIIGAAVFAAMHWCEGIGKIAFVFPIGVILSTWFVKRKQLYALIIFHAAFDWLAFNVP